MSTMLTILFLLAGLAIMIVILVRFTMHGGFQKPIPRYEPPTHAELLLLPGVTLDLVRMNGDQKIVVARVVLSNVTRDLDGTTAFFEDYFKRQERKRVR